MDPFEMQNRLRMARESGGDLNSIEEVAKEELKKEVKRQVLFWFLATVLPWIIVILIAIAIIAVIWYVGCFNPSGTFKGWVISKILKAKGICPAK